MDIINLKITNFLAIGDAPLIELKDKGLVLIQGVNEDDTSATSNGVGKSSIADALCWALYGETARGISGDAVVNKVAGKNCKVVVWLQDGATSYQIMRFRKDKLEKNKTLIYASSGTVESVDMSKGTEKETQEVINGIMGCSLDVFMAAIYAGQEVTPDLPKMTDKQLKLLIEEAAGVERLETAYEIARKKLATAKDSFTITQSHKESAINRTSTLKVDLASKALEAEQFDKGRVGRQTTFVENAKTYKDALYGVLTQMKGIDFDGLTGRSGELGTALAGHSVLLKRRDELKNGLAAAQRTGDAASIRQERAMKEVANLKGSLENAETENKKACPSCGKSGDEHDLASYKRHVTEKLKEAIAAAKNGKAASGEFEFATKQWSEKLTAFEATLPDVSEMTTEQAQITAKLREYDTLKLKATNNKVAMDRQNELAAATLTDTNPHASAIEMLNERLVKVQEELKGYEESLLRDEANMIVFENVAKVFSPAGVRAHILDTVTPFLNDRTGDYLSALSDGNINAVWTTLATTAKGELREKFCIEVANDKGAESFAGLSGGEKRKVRLATMLALQDLVASRATKPIGIWIGDEVDDALDNAGLERLMGILERKARERGTVLVISHNSLRDWIDSVVTVTKKDGLSNIEGALCL